MQLFNEKDLQQIEKKGISQEQLNRQLTNFKKGFKPIALVSAATPAKGIVQLNPTELDELIRYFEEQADQYDMLKFVPASGAASRMFKHLFEFLQEEKTTLKPEEEADFNSLGYLLHHLKNTAFYEDLRKVASNNELNLDDLFASADYKKIVELILMDKGLGYGNLPKALLKFHAYNDGSTRLALEEHLVEAANYCVNEDKIARIHFTISPEHKERFEEALQELIPIYEKRFGLIYEISLSEQKTSTDTLAVDLDNVPFRNEDGSLLFRPGGHGALIENVQDLEQDIIFIKNIDNIVPDVLRKETYRYKKAFGALLMKYQSKSFDFLDLLDDGNLTEEELAEARDFAENTLNISIPDAYEGYSDIEKIDFLYSALNRPIRICGMVKNEGEPGGGPFLTKDSQGHVSLQIVEASQIDMKEPKQAEIVKQATHFNPVDLVCGIFDFKGQKFDLSQFVDPETGFISIKSHDGRELKAMELPGLWNGAMADWITIFVETPLITFNPVKTVNDLLRPQHQLQ